MAKQRKHFSVEEIQEILDISKLNEFNLLGMLTYTQFSNYLRDKELHIKGFGRRLSLSTQSNIHNANLVQWAYSREEFENIYLKSADNGRYLKHHVYFQCVDCDTWSKMSIHHLLKRRTKQLGRFCCYKHYFTNHIITDEWRKRNSDAQFIAQNRVSTIEKNRLSQIKRFKCPKVKEHYRIIGQKLWLDEDYRSKQMKVNIAYSRHGTYRNLQYQSLLELSFCLWRLSLGDIVERSQHVIQYTFLNKNHLYFPDFVLNNNTIVEVKGMGKPYEKNQDRIHAKHQALTVYASKLSMNCEIIFGSVIPNKFKKEARLIHASQEKVTLPLQG